MKAPTDIETLKYCIKCGGFIEWDTDRPYTNISPAKCRGECIECGSVRVALLDHAKQVTAHLDTTTE